MERKTITQRILSSLLDTLHYWSGTLLEQGTAPPAPAPVPAPSASANIAPVQVGAHLSRQPMIAFTLFLDPPLADEVAKLAQVMQTPEQDVLIRLIKLAKMIRDFGLYGVPTPDGNHLSINIRRTGESFQVNLDCPAQAQHQPPAPPVPAAPSPPPTSKLN